MFPAKELHESSGSFIVPNLLSEGLREPVWCRIGASVVENTHGGVSKQDSVVPIDTVAVPNWCFPIRCCTSRVADSFDLTYYPRCRIAVSVVENSHGGVSKKDSVVPIDTVADPNWCFLLRCCTKLLRTLPTFRGIDRTSVVQDWGVSG